MSATLRIGLKLAWARHLKIAHFPDALIWIQRKSVICPVKCIIYHFCLIAALNIQTISIPVYKNVICGYFLQPSLVTASPDLNRPGSVEVKNQLGSDMRRPLPWYTDTDTIFRSWPGPGYVSGDRRVSGTFCQPRRHATRSQLHLKWTRTIYQCLMDRVFENWMNTRSRNMPKLTIGLLLSCCPRTCQILRS